MSKDITRVEFCCKDVDVAVVYSRARQLRRHARFGRRALAMAVWKADVWRMHSYNIIKDVRRLNDLQPPNFLLREVYIFRFI